MAQEIKHIPFSKEQLNDFLRVVVIFLVGMLTLFLLVETMSAVKTYSIIGDDQPVGIQNTISVTGEADLDVSPDITTFSWTAEADGKTVEAAQSAAASMSNKGIDYLKQNGIAANDIKTTGYYTNTKYSNSYRPCTVNIQSSTSDVKAVAPMAPTPSAAPNQGSGSSAGYAGVGTTIVVPPCGSESVPTGFTTTQTVEVKVRNIDKDPAKAGTLIAGLGSIGLKASSPVSTIENPDAANNAVREQAIIKARQQAEVLARDLGVSLVRVTSFNESNYPNYPVPYAMGAMAKSADSAAIPPELPAGTNKITSNVTITYQIR